MSWLELNFKNLDLGKFGFRAPVVSQSSKSPGSPFEGEVAR